MSPTLQRLFTVSGLLAVLIGCWLCFITVMLVVESSEKDLHHDAKFWTEHPETLLREIEEDYQFAVIRKGIIKWTGQEVAGEAYEELLAQVYLKATGEASVGEFQRDPEKIKELEEVWYDPDHNTVREMGRNLRYATWEIWIPLACMLFLCAVNWVATGSTRLRFWQPHPSAPR